MTSPTKSGKMVRIGEHMLTLEMPDLVVSRAVGEMSAADMMGMIEQVIHWGRQSGRIFWAADISRLGMVSPDARRASAALGNIPGMGGCVIFGGNFHQRLVTTLTVTAARLLLPRSITAPMAYVVTEAEARAWVAGLRGHHEVSVSQQASL